MRKTIIGFIVSLLVSSATVAEIYKWKDANGQVHFSSQCPNAACESVEPAPPSSYSPVPLSDTSTQQPASAKPTSTAPPVKTAKTKRGLVIKPGQCLDSIADTLGEGRVDPYESTASVKPSAEQYRLIKRFLTRLPGLLHGSMVEDICKGSAKNPDVERVVYRVDLDIMHDLRGLFDFKSLERGDNNIGRENNLKILITEDYFHVGETRSHITAKRWAAALLSVSANELVLLRQFRTRGPQGGSLQRMILRSYHFARGKLDITEYEYTQDQLVRIRKTSVK